MHEQNFERQVRQTLDELSLVPSPPVWDGVEAQIRRKKERRRFFFWLLPVILVAIPATWFLLREPNTAAPERPLQGATPPPAKPANKQENIASAPADREDLVKTEIPAKDPGNNVSKGKSVEKEGEIPAQQTVINTGLDQGLEFIAKNKTTTSKRNPRPTRSPFRTPDITPVESVQAQPADMKTESPPPSQQTILVDQPADTAAPVVQVQSVDTVTASPDSAVLVPKPKKQTKKEFEVGLVIAFGSSGVTTGLLDGLGQKALSDFNSVPVQNNAGGVPPRPPSNIKRGLFYSVGLTTNYKISSRVTLSAGLQYQQMNTEINVGSRGDSSFADLRMGSTYFDNSFSSPQRKYTNAFHFLGIPVSYQYQLHKRAPLYLTGGASFSRLLSTTALHFSPTNNIYYTDSSAMKKYAAGLFTSLTYDLHFKKGFRMEFGPLFQYSLTPTSKPVGTKPQHLYTLGLRSTLKFK